MGDSQASLPQDEDASCPFRPSQESPSVTSGPSDRVFTPAHSESSATGRDSGHEAAERSRYSSYTATDAAASSQSWSHSAWDDQGHDRLLRVATAGKKLESSDDEAQYWPRKRGADGELKVVHSRASSPNKGHSRNVSAISTASTSASTIGELSAELRTRLSYAMVKLNNGWQSNSIHEVEVLASQAASSTLNLSPKYRARGSPPSPPQKPSNDVTAQSAAKRPALGSPVAIQPLSNAAGQPARRRNSNPSYTPRFLSRPHTTASSLRTPDQTPRLRAEVLPLKVNPSAPNNRDLREGDAVEALLFMSSPGNSANLKHSFSPLNSPVPSQAPSPRRSNFAVGTRTRLPSKPLHSSNHSDAFVTGGVRALEPPVALKPLKRTAQVSCTHRVGTTQGGPEKNTVSRQPFYIPPVHGSTDGRNQQGLRESDIERMLDRADAEYLASSEEDDEEICIPHRQAPEEGIQV